MFLYIELFWAEKHFKNNTELIYWKFSNARRMQLLWLRLLQLQRPQQQRQQSWVLQRATVSWCSDDVALSVQYCVWVNVNMFVKLFQFQSVCKTCYKTIGKGVNCCGNPGNHEFAYTPQIFWFMPQVTLFFFPIFVLSLYSGVLKDDRCNINQRIFQRAVPEFWKTVHVSLLGSFAFISVIFYL